ncbi:MAG: AMP-binding protein, partial [Cytophagales bacterium]|nr:AMP-binding protein [Cytophagales bacterium]
VRRAPGVEETVITVHRKEDLHNELICYYTGAGVTPEALKAFLRNELNHNITPAYFMHLEAFPTNLNGKVDRRALPRPELLLGQAVYEPPRNAVEEEIAGIWEEVLGVQKIGRTTSFFRAGGTSTKAIQVISRLYRNLDVSVKVADLFANDTIARLGEVVARAARARAADLEIRPLEEQAHYAVSHAQKRLWINDQLGDQRHAYNVPGAYLLTGALDRQALERSFAALLARHESLRTVFPTVGGQPRQRVLDPEAVAFAVQYHDLGDLPESDREPAARRIAAAEASRPFDLARGPLVRAALVRLAPGRHAFLLTLHHIIADGWSMDVLAHEAMQCYDALARGAAPSLSPLALQYKDFSAWHNGQFRTAAFEAARRYWLDRFAGPVPVLDLPTDSPRPAVKNYDGDYVDFALSPELTGKLDALGREQGCSLFMTLLAAVNALLYRYTGQRDMVVGSPIFGRDAKVLESQIGCYVNTLALRTRLGDGDSFADLLAEVKQTTLEAFEHKMYPFDQLVEELDLKRDWSRSPLFDVWVVLQNTNFTGPRLPQPAGLSVGAFERDVRVSLHDLSFNFHESDTLRGTIVYNSHLFARDTIGRMVTHLLNLLTAVANDSRRPLREIRYLAGSEYRELLAFNGPRVPYPGEDKTLAGLFEEQVRNTPDRLAVCCEGTALTYRELNAAGNRLAHCLQADYGVGPGSLVALLLDRSADTLVALLAVLKAGGAYLP